MNFFYTSFILGTVQQNKEFTSHTIHQIYTLILSSKGQKNMKNVRIWRFFQILTYDNCEQTNSIHLYFFYTIPMLRILQQTEGFGKHLLKFHQIP